MQAGSRVKFLREINNQEIEVSLGFLIIIPGDAGVHSVDHWLGSSRFDNIPCSFLYLWTVIEGFQNVDCSTDINQPFEKRVILHINQVDAILWIEPNQFLDQVLGLLISLFDFLTHTLGLTIIWEWNERIFILGFPWAGIGNFAVRHLIQQETQRPHVALSPIK